MEECAAYDAFALLLPSGVEVVEERRRQLVARAFWPPRPAWAALDEQTASVALERVFDRLRRFGRWGRLLVERRQSKHLAAERVGDLVVSHL